MKPFFNLTAADLMTASVVMVPEEMSLQGAAHLLARACVTGAPVVNREGRCVGVLSATDFVHWVDKGQPHKQCAQATAFCAAWEIVEPEELPDDAVRNYMTRDVVVTGPTTTIGTLSRLMTDGHIHRIIVAGATGKPIGIVSSTDVLAALSRADQARIAVNNPGKSREALPC